MATSTVPRHARPSTRPPSRLRTAIGTAAGVARLAWLRLTRPSARVRTAWGLVRLGLFLLTHRSAPLPTGPLNVRVLDAPRGIRLTHLDAIADAYRTRVAKRFGSLVAERRFGGRVVVEAHVKDEDYSAQLAARMGSEVSA